MIVPGEQQRDEGWNDVVRTLVDAGIPVGRIRDAIEALKDETVPVREAAAIAEGDRVAEPAGFLAELLVAEAGRARDAIKVATR